MEASQNGPRLPEEGSQQVVAHMQESLTLYTRVVTSLTNRINDLKAQLAVADAGRRDGLGTIAALEAQLGDLRQQHERDAAAAAATHREDQQTIAGLRAQLEEQQQVAAGALAAAEAAQQQLQEQRAIAEAALRDAEAARQAQETARQLVAAMDNQRAAVAQSARNQAEATEAAQLARREAEEAREEAQRLKQRAAGHEAQQSRLLATMVHDARTLGSARGEADALRAHANSLKDEIVKHKNDFLAVYRQKQDAVARLALAEARVRELELEAAQRVKELEAARAKVIELEAAQRPAEPYDSL
jgi:colicin import membrane protein